MFLKNKPPFHFVPKYGSRIGVCPRHGAVADTNEDKTGWISLEHSCWIFHTVKAWEEENSDGGAIIKVRFICSLFDLKKSCLPLSSSIEEFY